MIAMHWICFASYLPLVFVNSCSHVVDSHGGFVTFSFLFFYQPSTGEIFNSKSAMTSLITMLIVTTSSSHKLIMTKKGMIAAGHRFCDSNKSCSDWWNEREIISSSFIKNAFQTNTWFQ